jgi:hypothetical protein
VKIIYFYVLAAREIKIFGRQSVGDVPIPRFG